MNQNKIKLDDINIHEFGNTIDLAGIVYDSEYGKIVALLPNEKYGEQESINIMEMTLDEWKKMIRQTDLLETEILQKAADGKQTKVILRKSARQVDQRVAWKVYERDHYTCQYCGIHGIPMTIDHLVLWENGGPTIEENLVTSCKKCNKTRGNTPFEEWLDSDTYKNRSKNSPSWNKEFLLELVPTLKDIEKVKHKKSR